MLSKSLVALLPLLITVSAAPHGGKRSCNASGGGNIALAYTGGRGGSGGSGTWTWGSGAQGSNTASIAVPSSAPVPASSASSADTAPVVSSPVPPVVSSTADVAATTNALGDGAVASAPSSSNAVVIASSAAVVAASSSSAPVAPVASSAAAAPSASSSTTTTTTTTAAATTSSGGAVGLGWGTNSGTDVASFGGKLAWYFNWDLNPSSNMGSLEFVPQVWGSGSVDGFTSSSYPSGTSHILSFNEPDQSTSVGGSGIDATTAASLHQQWTAQVPSGILIGSPAVARGGNQWMDDWISACAGNCRYDFVAFHFYGTDANDLITYAQDFYSTYNKPLWLTEWACTDYSTGVVCDADQVNTFMKTAITWFESDGASMVERWAWFGAFTNEASGGNPNGLENADGSANALGATYAGL